MRGKPLTLFPTSSGDEVYLDDVASWRRRCDLETGQTSRPAGRYAEGSAMESFTFYVQDEILLHPRFTIILGGRKMSFLRFTGEAFGFCASYDGRIEAVPTRDVTVKGRNIVQSANLNAVTLVGAEARGCWQVREWLAVLVSASEDVYKSREVCFRCQEYSVGLFAGGRA